MIFWLGKKRFSLQVEEMRGAGMYLGLMFRTKDTRALLFSFSRPGTYGIHSFFVFFPFLAIWLDEKNRVIESCVVRPFTTLVKPQRAFVRLIEIPLTTRNTHITRFFVGNGKV